MRNFPVIGPGSLTRLRASAMVMLALLTPMALAQRPAPSPTSTALAARFPAAAINSEVVADQALADATIERAGIEAQFANDERACYSKFFATTCLENAKSRRRLALRLVHRVEIDANTFKRRQRVVERDDQLEQRRASEALKAPPSAKPSDSALLPVDSAGKNSSSPATDARNNEARAPKAPRAAHPKVAKTEQPADAQKRAENVAAYDRKVAESEARQREVAEKKALKERERAAKESAAKENAAKESTAKESTAAKP